MTPKRITHDEMIALAYEKQTAIILGTTAIVLENNPDHGNVIASEYVVVIYSRDENWWNSHDDGEINSSSIAILANWIKLLA
jgi:hypothetical protein